MPNDALGLHLSAASERAAAQYRSAVDLHLHAWPGAEAAMRAAVADSPGFALAHANLALLLISRGDAAAAREALTAAKTTVGAASEREASHVALFAHLIEGRPREALAAVQVHAERWPLDAMANNTALGAFGLLAFSGRADHDAARLAFTEALAPHYPADHTWLLTQRAWARIEASALTEGRALLERSFALRRANGNAAHVAMHLHFEANEPAAALAFVDDWLAQYPHHAMLWGHLHWHAAITHLAEGNVEAAVARLTQRIEPHLAVAWPLVGLTDIASLLWRLALRDGTRALPWPTGEAFAARWFANGGNVFASIHLAMLAAARSDGPALALIAERMGILATGGHEGAAAAVHWVRALAARNAGDLGAARRNLAACHAEALRLGGSHAQRTVVERTLEGWAAADD